MLIEVVSWLDPTSDRDRAALCALVRVSRDLWEISAPVLYSNVSLTPVQLVALLDGNVVSPPPLSSCPPVLPDTNGASPTSKRSKLCPRAQRTFAWIKDLRLRPPPGHPEVYKLWDAAVPDVPLFPAVQRLVLDNPPGWEDRLRALNRAARDEFQREMAEARERNRGNGDEDEDEDEDEDMDLWSTRSSVDMGCLMTSDEEDVDEVFYKIDYTALKRDNIVIFGDVSDVCVRGSIGCTRLSTLPIRSVRNLAMHRHATTSVFSYGFHRG